MIYSYLCDALQPPPAENKNMLPPVLRILTFFDLIPDPTYYTELSGSDKVFLRLKTCRHCINLYKKSAWIWHQILIKNKNWSTNCFNWRQAAKRRKKTRRKNPGYAIDQNLFSLKSDTAKRIRIQDFLSRSVNKGLGPEHWSTRETVAQKFF